MSCLFSVQRLLVALSAIALLAVAYRQNPAELEATEQLLNNETVQTIDILKRRAAMRAVIVKKVEQDVMPLPEAVAYWRELNAIEPKWTVRESFQDVADKILRNIEDPQIAARKTLELKKLLADLSNGRVQ